MTNAPSGPSPRTGPSTVKVVITMLAIIAVVFFLLVGAVAFLGG